MFFKTDNAHKHSHILFLDNENKIGFASQDKKHTHEVTWFPGRPEQQDPQTGQIIPEQPAGWMIAPDPIDGHTHEIENLAAKSTQKKQKEDAVVEEVLDLFKHCVEIEKDSLEAAREAEKFFQGEHWEDADKAELNSSGRAAITENLAERYVDELSGYQRQTRTELKYRPQEHGDQKTADMWNIVVKHVLDKYDYQSQKTEQFQDMVVTGRGVLTLEIDRANDIRGELRVVKFPYDNILCGEFSQNDLSDCEVVIKHKMYSLRKVKQLWPDKADKVQNKYEDETKYLETSKHTSIKPDQYKSGGTTLGGFLLHDEVNKEIRVIECQQTIYKDKYVAINSEVEAYIPVTDFDEKIREQINTMPGFQVLKAKSKFLRITKVAGKVLLSDENPAKTPLQDFPVAIAYAKKRKNKWWGKVASIIDPSKQVNRLNSLAVDFGNKMAAYGWFIDPATFVNAAEERKFVENSSSPGFIAKVNDVGRPPRASEGIKYPSELINLLMESRQTIANLMNVSIRDAGANTSGSALLTQQKIKMTGNEFLFDHLNQAEKRLGRLLPAYIKQIYSADRIFRLLKNSSAQKELTLGGRPFMEWSQEEFELLYESADPLKYDVLVDQSNYSPSTRMATFMMLSDMIKAGLPVPPAALIEVMDVPDTQKQEIMAQFQQQNDKVSQDTQANNDAEVFKTLIAKGVIPPAVQQKYGVQGPVQLAPEQMGQPGTPAPVPTEGMPQQMPLGIDEGPGAVPVVDDTSKEVEYLQHRIESLGMLKEVVSAIQNNQAPITINVDPPRGKRKVGKIVRDEMGNATVEVMDIDDGGLNNGNLGGASQAQGGDSFN